MHITGCSVGDDHIRTIQIHFTGLEALRCRCGKLRTVGSVQIVHFHFTCRTGDLSHTAVGSQGCDFRIANCLELCLASAAAVFIIHAQVVQIQFAIGRNIHLGSVDRTKACSCDVHFIFSIQSNTGHLVHDTVNNDVLGSQFGVLSEDQISIDRNYCAGFGLLNLYRTAGCINDQGIITLTYRCIAAVRNDCNIAAIGLDVLLVLSGCCSDKTCNRRINRDLNAASLTCCCYLIDRKVGCRGRILADRDIRSCIARSDNITVGLCNHISVRHIEAEVSISVFTDDQVGRSAILDFGGGCASGDTGLCLGQIRCASVFGQIPVSSLYIHTDFRSQLLQPDLLVLTDRDRRRIVCSRCDGVENCVGLVHTQGIQCTIPELSKDIAHQQIQFAAKLDHAVNVIFEIVTQLTHIAKVFSKDVVGVISGTVKLGCEYNRVIFNDQIDYQAALGQVEGIGDAVAQCVISGLGVGTNCCGLNGNHNRRCILSCDRAINSQSGISTGIDAAGTNYQCTGA